MIPGKLLNTAENLSRNETLEGDISTRDVDHFIHGVIASLPASSERLDVYKAAQTADTICQQVVTCLKGWPEQRIHTKQLHPYWGARHKLTVVDDLLLYDSCIVVPLSLQAETMSKIHTGHMVIQKCLTRG